MRDGQKCRLDVSTWDSCPEKEGDACATVIGVVVGERRHLDDASRVLYYFHTLRVERPVDGATAVEKNGGLLMHPHRERREGLSVGAHGFNSACGFKYTFDGWYDDIFLYKIDEEALVPVQQEWRTAMEHDTSPCELLYLCYATRPWFQSPFSALQYMQIPERHVCYSVSVCHRCMSPFVSCLHMQEHQLGGYCHLRRPPGVLIYDDSESGRRVYYIDGAKHLHYARCLSLLGKAFIESKQLESDVDIYELFVVTAPRASLPYIPGEMDECTFRRAAAHFDEADWDGDVLVGYFTRLKHSPDHCLSCIVTLPMFQQKGLGVFMLDVAYRLTEMRQRLCGCEGACGRSGGAISRPFSPHGEALLLAYWRKRVTEALMSQGFTSRNRHVNDNDDNGVGEDADVGTGLSFNVLHGKVMSGGFCIHEEDLRFFLLKDERCFYTRTTPSIQLSTTLPRSKTLPNESSNNNSDRGLHCNGRSDATVPQGFVPPPSETIGSIVFFKRDAEQGKRRPGAFNEKFWYRDANGNHPYNKTFFHY